MGLSQQERKAAWRAIPGNRDRENELRRKRYDPEAEAHRWKETDICPVCEKVLCRRYIPKHIVRKHPQALATPPDSGGQVGEPSSGAESPRAVELDAGEDVADGIECLDRPKGIDVAKEDDSTDPI